ncbi:MAG TPA: beta-propeller fold lactonase family protein [Bryobacteraceae bacterium]|nr:beta-propeller fold lactonase family protein [Bryobacteraceae bacterium]
MNRRTAWIVLGLLAGMIGEAQPAGKVVVYEAVGAELTQYDVDIKGATLTKRGLVTLPDSVQYAWPHPSRRFIYVAWSNGSGHDHHGVTAYRIDGTSGALLPQGNPVPLPARPIHLSTDIPGTHLLVAYNEPSGLTVHQIGADGSIGSLIKQPASLSTGIYAHQVRVDPSNKMVILVTRGNGPTANKPEDPGALKVFGYQDGQLTNRASIAPGGGYGFQPRHLDFHTSGPWVFVSLERQSKLQVYRKLPEGTLSSEPLFTKDSLANPGNAPASQVAGTVHVHPNGRFVYQANRASGTTGQGANGRGENTIAVYSINQQTGEPTRIQNIDTRGMTPRTFALDASGRILVAANQNAVPNTVPASLSVYRVRDDGMLDFVRKYDVETADTRSLFWMGLVSLPAAK